MPADAQKPIASLNCSEQLFDALFEQSRTCIAWMDSRFTFIRVNRAYAAADAREPDFFPGKNHFDLYPNPENEAIFRRCVETGEAVSFVAKPFEYAEHPERGTTHWDWTLTPVKDAAGRVTGVVLSLYDVTDRVRTLEALTQARDHYRHLVETAHAIPWEAVAHARRFTYVGPQATELLGYPSQDWYADDFWEAHLHPDDRERVMRLDAEESMRSEDYDLEYRMIAADGRVVWVHDTVKVVREGTQAIRRQGFMFDATERRNAEARMRQLAGALEQAADSVLIMDANGVIEYVNRAFEKNTGYSAAEALGRKPDFLKSEMQDDAYYAQLWTKVMSGQAVSDVLINRNREGRLYYQETTITPLKDENGRITHVVATGKDITERVQTQERLRYLAQHDVVTGLPNRALFTDRLTHALLREREEGHVLALFFLDLDRFKIINDTLGHIAGDRALQLVADRLRASLREADTVARLGGDEFAILIEDLQSAGQVARVAQTILDRLAQPFVLDGQEFLLTASMDIALSPLDGTSADTLLRHADMAMNRAEELGRNTYQFYRPEMSLRAIERLNLETHLRHALERGEFELHYQPQVDVAEGRLVGLEALLRWRRRDRQLVAPGDFIPVLEESGLVIPVGEWVLHTACTQARDWQRAGHRPVAVSVNVSGRQFRAGFDRLVEKVLRDSGLAARWLELEMTESVMFQQAAPTVDILLGLKALGLRVAIDDFGTGYSSFAYLKRFRVDTVKIDQSFVRNVTANLDDAAIVDAVIAMASRLGIGVIAEGVETEEQLEFLRHRSCTIMQGALFGAPLPAHEVPRALDGGASLHA